MAALEGDPWKVVSASNYGLTLVLLYSFSVLYHSLRRAKNVLRELDHQSIYLLIPSVVIYVLMGWVALVAVVPLLKALGTAGFAWVAAGGLFYTIGIVFYALDVRLAHAHGVRHLFVIGGSVTHYVAILRYVVLAG